MKNLILKKDINNFLYIIRKDKYKKILIISGKNSFFKSGANVKFKKSFVGKKVEFFFKNKKLPEFEELKRIISCIKKNQPDLILAIGGGCVMDYAKLANVLTYSDNLKKDILKNSALLKKFTTLFAIPTTAGSGAEVTPQSVIYIDKIKYSVAGREILPDEFFLFPDLVIKSPKIIKSSSGFDAIAQAVESMFSPNSNKKSFYYSKKSLELSLKNIVNSYKRPSINNTFEMSLAACYSGKAISITKTSVPHALSYPFTAHFGINHGHAVSLTFNEFLKFNFIHSEKSKRKSQLLKVYKILFSLTKSSSIIELDNFFKKIKDEIRLENDFEKLKIDISKDLNKIISGVSPERLSNAPISISKKDIKNFLFRNYV